MHWVIATFLKGTVHGVAGLKVLVALDYLLWHFVGAILFRRANSGQPLHQSFLADWRRGRLVIERGLILIIIIIRLLLLGILGSGVFGLAFGVWLCVATSGESTVCGCRLGKPGRGDRLGWGPGAGLGWCSGLLL